MAEEGSPFWRFSLSFYRRPGVAEACLMLQDAHRVDVNVLMFVLWQASLKRSLSEQEIRQIDDRVRDWRVATIIPLRTQRRALKEAPPSLLAPDAAEAFRTRVKTLELEAERLQQEAMYRLSTEAGWGEDAASAAAAARQNLAAYQQLMVCQFPESAVTALQAAIDGQ